MKNEKASMKNQIVIIDDDHVYRLITFKMIHHVDNSLEIHQCENALIGLETLVSFENSDHPITVLLDINLPLMNGWDFLKKLEKSHPDLLNTMDIYMVSSSTDDSDIFKSKTYKFLKGFISKPLNKENIKTILGVT